MRVEDFRFLLRLIEEGIVIRLPLLPVMAFRLENVTYTEVEND